MALMALALAPVGLKDAKSTLFANLSMAAGSLPHFLLAASTKSARNSPAQKPPSEWPSMAIFAFPHPSSKCGMMAVVPVSSLHNVDGFP